MTAEATQTAAKYERLNERAHILAQLFIDAGNGMLTADGMKSEEQVVRDDRYSVEEMVYGLSIAFASIVDNVCDKNKVDAPYRHKAREHWFDIFTGNTGHLFAAHSNFLATKKQ